MLTEADARASIISHCRALWDRRLVTGTSGNVSLKLSDGDLLVTPAGRSLRNVRAEELVRIDAKGKSRDRKRTPSTELPLHLAAYKARPETLVVIHTHPTYCVVWSKFGCIFPRDTVGATETLGECAWTPYNPPGSQELADVTAAEFARGANTVLMERHGISCLGKSLDAAFVLSDLAEEAARIAYFSKLAALP
ncbi:MAG: class II aldolase/adducin family protein [Candidatus Eremiobacteraeota bacterium]|nr:class II aldolase/adducin family protein [Candidatus Eremiobacteraeota bacterium]